MATSFNPSVAPGGTGQCQCSHLYKHSPCMLTCAVHPFPCSPLPAPAPVLTCTSTSPARAHLCCLLPFHPTLSQHLPLIICASTPFLCSPVPCTPSPYLRLRGNLSLMQISFLLNYRVETSKIKQEGPFHVMGLLVDTQQLL